MLVLIVIIDNNLSEVYKIKSFHEGHDLIVDDFQEIFNKSLTAGQFLSLRENNSLQYIDTVFHVKYNWIIKEVSER